MRFLTLILLLFVNSIIAQERQLTSDSDTLFWFNWRAALNKEIGIPTIDKSSEEFEFRFWDGVKVVRLWENEDELYSEVIFFLREYRDNKERDEGRLFHTNLLLNKETTVIINQLIEDLEILQLPSDDKIERWKQGLDGITYIVETCSPGQYSFKSYWTPSTNLDIRKARIFQDFVDKINLIEPIENGAKKFISKQPFRSYYSGIDGVLIATQAR